jgi:hypothetical protein
MTNDLRTPQATAIEEHRTVKSNPSGFYGPVLRSIVLIVSLSALVPYFTGMLHKEFGGTWLAATMVFVLASYALMAMVSRSERSSTADLGKGARRLRIPDWTLVTYGALTGLGFTWDCVFLCFSGRYGLFSNLILGVTIITVLFYVIIASLVARLTKGNWWTVLLILAIAPGVLAGVVLRLGLRR